MYNSSSCSGFSCSYSGSSCAKSYSSSSLDNIVYSMSDSVAASDSYVNVSFEGTINRAYDNRDDYQETKKKEAVMNTSAGIDSSYLIGQQNFNPSSFLNPERPKARFITNVEELLPIITETFEKLV